jgi:hypothetical protein
MGAQTSPNLSDEKASRMLAALREGRTLRKFGITRNCPRFKTYCEAHPGYAREALPLAAPNQKAADRRKGELKRKMASVVCLKGLHPMSKDNVSIHKGRRCCIACRRIAAANPPMTSMTPDVVEKIKDALQGSATIGQICQGRPVGGGKQDRKLVLVRANVLYRYRQLNPEFDRFVAEAIADSKSVGQKLRFSRVRGRIHTARVREEANDYHRILALFPTNFPGRDDAAHDLFVAVFERSLKREDVRARVKHCLAAHNRMFPTKYAKFAGRPLVSLDAQLFNEGTMPLGDTISRGLWD